MLKNAVHLHLCRHPCLERQRVALLRRRGRAAVSEQAVEAAAGALQLPDEPIHALDVRCVPRAPAVEAAGR